MTTPALVASVHNIKTGSAESSVDEPAPDAPRRLLAALARRVLLTVQLVLALTLLGMCAPATATFAAGASATTAPRPAATAPEQQQGGDEPVAIERPVVRPAAVAVAVLLLVLAAAWMVWTNRRSPSRPQR